MMIGVELYNHLIDVGYAIPTILVTGRRAGAKIPGVTLFSR